MSPSGSRVIPPVESVDIDREGSGDFLADPFPATSGHWRWIDRSALCVLAIGTVALRFWTESPLWLDEALTVHIAQQPLGQIPSALRHDGHPPLYYLLLHGWMSMFGSSDRVIRMLPGLLGVLVLPLTWLVGRRIGGRSVAWLAVVFVAVSPYAVRYSTENRMYSLLMLGALAAWLCVDSILRRPRVLPVIGLVLCTSMMLWSQYWSIWLGCAAAMIMFYRLWRDRRDGDGPRVRADLWVLGALAVGACSFLPWIPTMLYQQAHTGTPWASRSMPPTVLVNTVEALGGPSDATDRIAGWIFMLAIVLGMFGLAVGSAKILLELRTRPPARPLMWIAGLTFAIGSGVTIVANTAFQPRYNAVWLPFAFVLAGFGLAAFRGPRLQRGALAVVVLVAIPGLYKNVTLDRTQAASAAAAIQSHGSPGDVVGVCPDQLGPSLTRELAPGFEVGSYPTFSDPHTVDWVDYVARTRAATPAQFADDLLRRAGDDQRIFVVWSGNYTTHKKLCEEVVQILASKRPAHDQILEEKRLYYESENVDMFGPARNR